MILVGFYHTEPKYTINSDYVVNHINIHRLLPGKTLIPSDFTGAKSRTQTDTIWQIFCDTVRGYPSGLFTMICISSCPDTLYTTLLGCL